MARAVGQRRAISTLWCVTPRQFAEQKERLDAAWRAQDRARLQAEWDRL